MVWENHIFGEFVGFTEERRRFSDRLVPFDSMDYQRSRSANFVLIGGHSEPVGARETQKPKVNSEELPFSSDLCIILTHVGVWMFGRVTMVVSPLFQDEWGVERPRSGRSHDSPAVTPTRFYSSRLGPHAVMIVAV